MKKLTNTPARNFLSMTLALFAIMLFTTNCGDSPFTPAPPGKEPPDVSESGLVKVTFSGIGTNQMSAAAQYIPANKPSIQGNTSANIEYLGTIEFEPANNGSFTYQSRGPFGRRYVFATFEVYTSVEYDNLTFIAVDTDLTYGQTAVHSLRLFNGTELTGTEAEEIANAIKPTGRVILPDNHLLRPVQADVLALFSERELNEILNPPDVTDIFPYGFITHSPGVTPGSRRLPPNSGGRPPGVVTFAFKLPLQSRAIEDPFEISMMFVPVDDNETRVSQSLEEQTPEGQALFRTRADELTDLHEITLLPGGIYTGIANTRLLCSPVRVAGLWGAATSVLLFRIPELQSITPNPYASGGSFLSKEVQVQANFDLPTLNKPSAANFTVNGSQSGKRFPGGGYSLAGINVTTPTGRFNSNEVIEVTLTTGLGPCQPEVFRYRVGSGQANGTFITEKNISLGGSPRTADFAELGAGGPLNGLDMVVTNYLSNSISVLIDVFDSSPGAKRTYITGSRPTDSTFGDFDGDGDLDIAVTNQISGTLSVLLNNGNGTFEQPSVNYNVGSQPMSVTAGDLNGDGDLDLAVANAISNNVSVLRNNGYGTFAPSVYFDAGSFPGSVASGDLNNDGTLDLAITNYETGKISILINNGNRHASFAAPVQYTVGSHPVAIAIGDLNNDGLQDLAVANGQSNSVSVLINNGNGTFGGHTVYSSSAVSTSNPLSIDIGDLDGDGDLDITVPNSSANTISVFKNTGTGAFNPSVEYNVSGAPASITLVNADKGFIFNYDLDIAVVLSSNEVELLKNENE